MTNQLETYFKDRTLLDTALTHRSWINEHQNQRESNERLEFLGDAVLEFVVSKELFKKLPDKEEGYLTALRANLVNTTNLARVARQLNIGSKLYLSKGEEEGGGRNNSSILADCVEAIIGALFLDGGVSAAEDFIKKYVLSDLDKKLKQPLKDAKSYLQELVQARGFMAPRYEVVKEEGPDHDKTFTVEVIINGRPVARGVGKNKNIATQNAAKAALKHFS